MSCAPTKWMGLATVAANNSSNSAINLAPSLEEASLKKTLFAAGKGALVPVVAVAPDPPSQSQTMFDTGPASFPWASTIFECMNPHKYMTARIVLTITCSLRKLCIHAAHWLDRFLALTLVAIILLIATNPPLVDLWHVYDDPGRTILCCVRRFSMATADIPRVVRRI